MATRLPAGAIITCANGHYICRTDHEMVASADRPMVKAEWFVDFAPGQYKPKPKEKANVCICAVCTAPWVAERPGFTADGFLLGMVAKLHANGDWWPPARR